MCSIQPLINAYQHLIQRDRMVREILPDLVQLVQLSSRDPLVWQRLGNALAQEEDMQHARLAYDRAQKLMQ